MKDSIAILGKGFIGTKLYTYLNNTDYNVKIFKRIEMDYTDMGKLTYWLEAGFGAQCKWIINTSGYTGIPNIDSAESNRQECWFNNVEVPQIIATALSFTKSRVKTLMNISSGCIYSGYDKKFNEYDIPNFGMFNANSSFYSKTKHAAELVLEKYCNVISFRIRMPFCGDLTKRNYITKLINYNNLIDMPNSLTNIDDFCEMIYKWIKKDKTDLMPMGPINVVNPGEVKASDIINKLKERDVVNHNHKFIPLDELKTRAARSNCVLDSGLLDSLGLGLPHVQDSLERSVKLFAKSWNDIYNDEIEPVC